MPNNPVFPTTPIAPPPIVPPRPSSPMGNPMGPAFPDYRHPTPTPVTPSQLPAIPTPTRRAG